MKNFIEFITEHSFEIITLILSIGGGVFALYQWKQSIKNNRANYVDQLLSRMQNDSEIKEFLFMVDYEHEWYDSNYHNHNVHDIAVKASKTLFFLNYLCYISDTKIIKKKEERIFTYYIKTIAQDHNTKSYLLDLYQYTVANDRAFPFEFYMNYCISMNCLPKEVKDENYFMYVMINESVNRNDISIAIPEAHQKILNSLGKSLFLKSYSRCEFCKNYISDRKCGKTKKADDHYWLLSNNKCDEFLFDLDKWEKMRKAKLKGEKEC